MIITIRKIKEEKKIIIDLRASSRTVSKIRSNSFSTASSSNQVSKNKINERKIMFHSNDEITIGTNVKQSFST